MFNHIFADTHGCQLISNNISLFPSAEVSKFDYPHLKFTNWMDIFSEPMIENVDWYLKNELLKCNYISLHSSNSSPDNESHLN